MGYFYYIFQFIASRFASSMANGIYKVAEKTELDFLNQFDFSKLTCLDVGSNIGYWAIYLGSKLGAKQVHCFEPDPILFSILKRNIFLNKIDNNTFANEFAICETD